MFGYISLDQGQEQESGEITACRSCKLSQSAAETGENRKSCGAKSEIEKDAQRADLCSKGIQITRLARVRGTGLKGRGMENGAVMHRAAVISPAADSSRVLCLLSVADI